jgi:hypothetical protein
MRWTAALVSDCYSSVSYCYSVFGSTILAMDVQVGEAKKGDGLVERPTVLQKRRVTEQLFGANRLTSTSFTVRSCNMPVNACSPWAMHSVVGQLELAC